MTKKVRPRAEIERRFLDARAELEAIRSRNEVTLDIREVEAQMTHDILSWVLGGRK